MDALIVRKVNLKPGEETVKIVRHYGLTFCPQIFAVFLLLTLPFFFLFPLFKLGYWGVSLFSFLLILGVVFGLRTLFIWYYNAFVITKQRIIDIDQRGFFERVVSEAPLEKIQDVSYRIKGIFQTLLRYGSVRVQTAGATAELELHNIKDPEKIQELIANLSRLDIKKSGEGDFDPDLPEPAKEEFKIIRESVNDLSERQLEGLEVIVRNKLRQMKLKRLEEIKNIGKERDGRQDFSELL